MRILSIPERYQRAKALREAQARGTAAREYYREHAQIGNIHYYVDGNEDAPVTVVFVHGFTLAASSWYLQVEHIASRARCVLMDFRGHGNTGEYPIDALTVDKAADDVVEVIRAAKVQGPCIVVGHSLGGMIVLNLLRRYPRVASQIDEVLLIATAVDSFASQGVPQILALPVVDKIRDFAVVSPRETTRLRQEISALVAPTLKATVFNTPTPEELINFHADLIANTPLNTFVGFLDDLQEHEEVAGAQLLQDTPGLVIVGEKDQVTPQSQAERIQQLWPGAGLQVIPGAGHMIILEQPWVINNALDSLINFLR